MSSLPRRVTPAAGCRRIPLHITAAAGPATRPPSPPPRPQTRAIPEGRLSREESSDGGDDADPTRTLHPPQHPAAAPLPACAPARAAARGGQNEDDAHSWASRLGGSRKLQLPTGLRVLPEGMLSREEEQEEEEEPGRPAAQGCGQQAGGCGCGGGVVASPPRRAIIAAAVVEPAAAVPPPPSPPPEQAPPVPAAAAAPSSDPAPDPAAASAAGGAAFVWSKQWWAVAPVDCLDPARPHPFTLLGTDLVLWRDGTGTWRAFRDACPHRQVPLSEGRVEADGSLMCAYHGWRFDGGGACTAMPGAEAGAELQRAAANPRSRCAAHPTRQEGGLLWVWGEAGPGAEAESGARRPVLPGELTADGRGAPGVTAPGWTFRDLPYGHVYFIENVVDPAHVPVSHHKIAGNRYRDPAPTRMALSRPPSLEGGFEVAIANSWRKDVRDSTTAFLPPGHVRIVQNHHNGSRTILALYSTPTRPGWTRHVGQQLLVEAPGGGPRGSGLAFFGLPLPRWLAHTLASLFLHQDLVFLHHQERILAQQRAAAGQGQGAGAGPRPPPYFMPTSDDKGVAAWHSWLRTFAGGDVAFAPGTPPRGPRETDPAALFDAGHTHTRQCAVCLRALARLRAVRTAATVAGLAAAAAALVSAAARAAAEAAAAAAATATGGTAVGAAPPLLALPVLLPLLPLLLPFLPMLLPVMLSAPLLLPLSALQALPALAGGVAPAAWLAVAALAGAVTWGAWRLERLMHVYEFSHADNN